MTRNELLNAAETYLEYSRAYLDKAVEVSALFCATGLKVYHEMHNSYCEQANAWTTLAREALNIAKAAPL